MCIFVNIVISILGLYHEKNNTVCTKTSILRIFHTTWLIPPKDWSQIKCSATETSEHKLVLFKSDSASLVFQNVFLSENLFQIVWHEIIFQFKNKVHFSAAKNLMSYELILSVLCLHS